MSRRVSRVLVLLGLGLVGLLLQASVAGAVVRNGPPPSRAKVQSNTDMKVKDWFPGQGVTGFIADPANGFDPVRDGYPSSDPPTGQTPSWSSKNEGFAGVIHGTPTEGEATLNLYCIDINTDTTNNIGYFLGSWETSGVPNVGYVARILNDYYPATDKPTGLSDNQKAAAVQAAIWFFSDRYVVSTSDSVHGAVVAIVDDVKARGPLVQPPPPTLTLTPANRNGPRSVLGPFTVTTDAPPAIVHVAGGEMFSNRAGTMPIADQAPVDSGQQIWLRSSGTTAKAVLQATSTATVPSGNVYLYDGNAGVSDAQRLILAQKATLKTTVFATAEFLPFGSLIVKKRVTGPAAGSQGQVEIRVACDDDVTRPPFIINAGAPARTRLRIYRHIEAGTKCTVTETSNGSVTSTDVVVIGDGQVATIPSGRSVTVTITDVYRFVPGSLIVRKTIAGPASGQQGPITIHSECNSKALTPDFVIPAGAPAGTQTKPYDGIPAPAKCTVTETADGHTSAVSVVIEGSGQTVSVPPGDIVEADISDTYGLVPGQLEVTKTIVGTLAGFQGTAVIHTVCGGTPLAPDLVVPEGTPAGDQSQIYSGIPTPANCTVTETTDGHTSSVSVAVTGSPATVSIPAGGAGAAHITDTYGSAPGSLLVTKSIAGPLAGQQGPIVIHAVCNGTARSPDFVIGAGSKAGSLSHSFDGIPAGSVCTVTETADGGTTTVAAIVAGSGQTVTVPAGTVVPVSLADTYGQPLGEMEDVVPPLGGSGPFQPVRGYLKVTKTMMGAAARQHGPIEILVDCGPAHAFAFLIPAHVTGTVSRVFPDLPRGTRCTVTETENGHTNTVGVLRTRKRRHVRVPAKGGASVRFTDTFSPIVVISGPPPGLG